MYRIVVDNRGNAVHISVEITERAASAAQEPSEADKSRAAMKKGADRALAVGESCLKITLPIAAHAAAHSIKANPVCAPFASVVDTCLIAAHPVIDQSVDASCEKTREVTHVAIDRSSDQSVESCAGKKK